MKKLRKLPVNNQVLASDTSDNNKKCPIRVQLTEQGVGITEARDAVDIDSYDKLTVAQQSQYIESVLMNMVGTANPEAARYLIQAAMQVVAGHRQSDFAYNTILQLIHGIGPAEPLEAMLALQAIVLYAQGMKCLAKVDQSEQSLSASIKLLRLQQETTERLERIRRKGEQRVVVQHVQISGGNAIVGNFEANGGGPQNSPGSTPWQ